ncbi:hypothetical protein [Neobacillus soli]|uniref:hypothetical protein n=1 Tax=Neobacillus soli TaxID=220688 RepID=UPI0012EDFA38|nr:hypothetical protein [Neobacillus soli]
MKKRKKCSLVLNRAAFFYAIQLYQGTELERFLLKIGKQGRKIDKRQGASKSQ